MRRFGITAAVVTIAVLALVPAADAKTVGIYHQIRALVPSRISEQIGFVPIGGIGGLQDIVSIRSGGVTYKGPWANATAGRLSLTQALRELRRYGTSHGAYADRPLTRAERRYFEVLADIGRDADVLAVRSGHPACSGLTLAQARGIASGRIKQWSEVAPGAGGAIALRDTVVTGAYEPRFGVAKKPKAAKGRPDGGVADAAKDPRVAAITSWSRARGRSGICAVPLGGISPSNATVFDLTFPGAYPVTFVAPKKRDRDNYSRTLLRLYVKFLNSEKAKRLFAGNGLLVEAPTDQPGPGGGSAGGPSQDAQGNPISPVRDDAGAASALTGERLETTDQSLRWVFEPGSVLHLLDSSCARSTGSWTVVEGWRYSENGGGVIAVVQTQFEQIQQHTVELPSAAPSIGYIDGRQYNRSRDLPSSC